MISALSGLQASIKQNAFGVLICFLMALIAYMLAPLVHAPIILLSLCFGLLGHSFFFRYEGLRSGINISSQKILRFGVILIGARLAFSDFLALGILPFLLIVLSILLLFIFTFYMSRLLKLDRQIGFLIGGACAICGASAAMAFSALLPACKEKDQNTAIAIVSITLMGTLAMLIYPLVIGFLALDEASAALIIGGTIHDVAQVVGAAYSISDPVGDQAVLIKLIRVAMLVPCLFICAYIISQKNSSQAQGEARVIQFPLFILGFMFMAGMNSFNLISEPTLEFLKFISQFCLYMALAAIGLKTPFQKIIKLGAKPILLALLATLFLIALYSGAIAFLEI